MDLNFLRSRTPQAGSGQPLGGRYKIIEQLGIGGFGQTFRAQDLHLPGHPLCVVKQLKPQVEDAEGLQVARRLFDTEANVLYQLGSHPQIPHLLAHFEQDQEFYLAQELIEGHSMADEFEMAPWDVPKVIAFLGDVLKTLAFVHDNRVIHRDLKPSNLIRRRQDNRIVVIDFGAVKQAGTQPAGSGISHTISIGTQGYMPNEQLVGQPQFSSDVYAIGIMGIQALTGRPPKQIMPNAQTGELDWHHYVPHIPGELITILDTMVRYDFRTRYLDAKAALAALAALPNALGQHIPGDGRLVQPAARTPQPMVPPPAQPPTGRTIAAMAQPQPTAMANGARRSVATEVVPMPSHRPSARSPHRSPQQASRQSTGKMPAIVIGAVILGVGLLIGRACTSAAPNNAGVTATTETSPSGSLSPESATGETISEPLVDDVATAEPTAPTSSEPPLDNTATAEPTEPALSEPPANSITPDAPADVVPSEPPADNIAIEEPIEPAPSEPPADNIAIEEPTEPAPSEPPANDVALTPATAQTVVTNFYSHLSSQAWGEAKAQTSGSVAQQFDPNFFRQFQQVSVENLQIQAQTPEGVKFLGHNTYVYNDGSTQREARTFTVKLVDGQPRIVDSAFVRVIEAR